jgi:protein-tyrosine phosphatase
MATMLHHPDRHLPLDGATNFRDLGGYVGQGGRALRWRRLFRSDHLAGLSAADQARLAELGLARAVDFRGIDERAATPYQVPGVQQQHLSIEPSVVQRMQDLTAAGRTMTADLVVGLMQQLYRELINDHAHRFASLFQQLLHDDSPLVFHCTAGKDRTGVAAALILLALGVPRDVVMQDFLLSNTLYQRPAALPHSDTPPQALAVLWRVQDSFLHAALQAVDDEQGGLDVYLQRRLGLGPAQRQALAARFLAD